MNDVSSNPYTLVLALYAFAAIFAISACWLLFRFNIRREQRRKDGSTADLLGLEEALTATALALGCAGVGFLISLTI